MIRFIRRILKRWSAKRLIVERAIAYREHDGCSGTDCDLKNAVEDYLDIKKGR